MEIEIISTVLEDLMKQKQWGIDNLMSSPYEYNIEKIILDRIDIFKEKKKELKRYERDQKQFYSMRILEFENALREYREKKKQIEKQFKAETDDNDIIGTARQSSIAFHYMEKLKRFPRHSGEFLVDARFIRFLTGNNLDTIRKTLSEPLKREDSERSTRALIKDLNIILNQFKQIQFQEGVELVENDLEMLQNDLGTFKEI